MQGDLTFGQAFSEVFNNIGDLVFRLIPAALSTIAEDYSTAVEAPPLTVPVSAPNMVRLVEQGAAPEFYNAPSQFWSALVPLSIFISLLLGAIIIYCFVRVQQIREYERVAL